MRTKPLPCNEPRSPITFVLIKAASDQLRWLLLFRTEQRTPQPTWHKSHGFAASYGISLRLTDNRKIERLAFLKLGEGGAFWSRAL